MDAPAGAEWVLHDYGGSFAPMAFGPHCALSWHRGGLVEISMEETRSFALVPGDVLRRFVAMGDQWEKSTG